MLNELEKITVTAFLRALLELDSPLPESLQAEINKVGEIWTGAPTNAANQLILLANNDGIRTLYWQARIHLQEQYENQEGRKNPVMLTPSAEQLENIALQIFQSVDSKAEAEKYKSLIMPEIDKSQELSAALVHKVHKKAADNEDNLDENLQTEPIAFWDEMEGPPINADMRVNVHFPEKH